MLEQSRQRNVLGGAVDPQAHVRGGAHLQADARGDHGVQQRRILARAHAVPQPRRPQGRHHVAHVLGPQQLAAVRERGESRAAGDREGGLPRAGPAGALVVAQPEADDRARSVPRIPGCEPGERARVQGVAHAGGRHHDGDLDPRQDRRLARRVEDDLQRRREASHEGGVGGRIHLDLQAPRALCGVVERGLQHDPAHGLLSGDQVAGGVVGPLEAEPAAVVGRDPERVAVDEGRRQARARGLGQVHQRLQAHRPREVQMQVRLGQAGEVAHETGLCHAPGRAGPGRRRRRHAPVSALSRKSRCGCGG